MNSLEILALIISLLALYISARSTWAIHFKPGKIVANVPYLVMWQFSSYAGERPTGDVCNRYITPCIWLGNVGALSVLVEEIRIRIVSETGECTAYPVAKVGLSIVEDPIAWKEKVALTGGGPMPGFAIRGGDEWRNEYAFSTKLERFENLTGPCNLHVEVKESGKEGWNSIKSEKFDFGSHPHHLRPLKEGNQVSGSQLNWVYSMEWRQRREP